MWNCSQHLLDPFQVNKLPQRSVFPRGRFVCKKRVDPPVNSNHDIQATDGTRTRIWRHHKPLHGQFCHSRSIPGAT